MSSKPQSGLTLRSTDCPVTRAVRDGLYGTNLEPTEDDVQSLVIAITEDVIAGLQARTDKQAETIRGLSAEIERLQGEVKQLQEALTPSADTKAAYSGEFSFEQTTYGDQGQEYTDDIMVPWSTIKEIIVAIRKRAAEAAGGETCRNG